MRKAAQGDLHYCTCTQAESGHIRHSIIVVVRTSFSQVMKLWGQESKCQHLKKKFC